MGDREMTELEVEEIVAETDRAFLCVIGGDEHWLPKSQVEDPDEFQQGDVGVTMVVTLWIADQKGLS